MWCRRTTSGSRAWLDSAANKFRLVNVNPQTLYFSDRPVRIAGHYRMAHYLKDWTAGRDNFGKDHPNATLSVYEPGQAVPKAREFVPWRTEMTI